jgi:hypothetical protein
LNPIEPLSWAVASAIWRPLRAALLRGQRSASPARQPLDPEDPAGWVGLDFVYDQVRAQMDQQQKLWEEADGRLRLILGVIGIVFAVTLGLLPRGTTTVSSSGSATSTTPLLLPFQVGALAIVGLVLFAIAGLIAAVAYWPRDFSWPPAPDSLRRYITTNPREIKLTALDALLEAYVANDVWVGRKFQAFRWALVVTGIATVALGASVIIELAQLTRAFS